MVALNSIADFVASLTDKERGELQTQLSYREVVSTRVHDKFSLTDVEDVFWGAMCEAMRDLRLDLPGPAKNVIGSTQGKLSRKELNACAVGLNDFVTYSCSIKLDRTHHRAICVVVLRCLVQWMKRRRYKEATSEFYFIPITARTICREIGELPRAVNLSFPGYVESRMLHVVVPREIDQGRLRVA
jgi:hypothetical protein